MTFFKLPLSNNRNCRRSRNWLFVLVVLGLVARMTRGAVVASSVAVVLLVLQGDERPGQHRVVGLQGRRVRLHHLRRRQLVLPNVLQLGQYRLVHSWDEEAEKVEAE